MTDSPNSNYSNNTLKETQLVNPISLQNATYAYAKFNAKWNVEADYDYVQFMASTDNGITWTPLCGKYTNIGVASQDLGQPLYDGIQSTWVQEEIDLTDYLGMSDVRFKFKLVSDQYVTEDGFAFDDFNIYTNTSNVGINELEQDVKVYPNPAQNMIVIQSDKETEEITIVNQLGQTVYNVKTNQNQVVLNTSNYENGVYFIKIKINQSMITKKITILK
jgi:hypothetical protein